MHHVAVDIAARAINETNIYVRRGRRAAARSACARRRNIHIHGSHTFCNRPVRNLYEVWPHHRTSPLPFAQVGRCGCARTAGVAERIISNRELPCLRRKEKEIHRNGDSNDNDRARNDDKDSAHHKLFRSRAALEITTGIHACTTFCSDRYCCATGT
jgi:hypothetical protein